MNRKCPECGNDFPQAMVSCRECGYRPQIGQIASKDSSSQSSPQKTEAGGPTVANEKKANALGTGRAKSSALKSSSEQKITLSSKEREPSTNVEQSANDARKIVTTCNKCDRRIKAPSKMAGAKIRCPRCGSVVNLDGEPEVVPQFTLADQLQREVANSLELPEKFSVSKAPPKKSSRKDSKLVAGILSRSLQETPAVDSLDGLRDAISKIHESRDIKFASKLIQGMEYIPDHLKPEALKAIANAQVDGAYEFIIAHLGNRERFRTKDVVDALGILQDARAVRPLALAHALFVNERAVIRAAVGMLGEETSRHLLDLVENNRNPEVRASAISLLEQFKSKSLLEVLERSTLDQDLAVRRQAVKVISRIQEKRAVNILVKMAQDDDDEIRVNCSQGLITRADPRSAAALVALLQDKNRDVQLNAIKALGYLQKKNVFPQIVKFLDHSEEDFQIAAVEALGRHGNLSSVPVLLELLESRSDSSQLTLKIVDALRRLHDSRAVLPLLNLLEASDPRIQQSAIAALGAMQDSSVREPLEHLLSQGKSEQLRAEAANSLGHIADKKSIPALEKALLDTNPVRVKAIIALSKFENAFEVSTLKKMLTDPASQVRYQAAKILGEIGDDHSIADLEDLINDPEPIVNRAALKAMASLGDNRSEDQIRNSIRKKKRDRNRRNLLIDLVPSTLLGLLSAMPGGLITVVGSLLLLSSVGMFVLNPSSSSAGRIAISRGNVEAVDLSFDGSWIAVARTRGVIEIWDSSTKDLIESEQLLPNVRSIVLSKQLGTLVLASTEGVMFSDVSKNGKIGEVSQPDESDGKVTSIVSSPDQKFVVSIETNGTCRRFDLSKRSSDFSITSDTPPCAVALSQDSNLVALGDTLGSVKVISWGVADPILEHQIQVMQGKSKVGEIQSISFSQDNSHLALCTSNGILEIVELSTGETKRKIDLGPFPARVSFGEGEILYGADREVWKLNDWTTGNIQKISDGLGTMSAATFCLPKQAYVGGNDEDSPVVFVDLRSGDETIFDIKVD